jgi:hypothetical protein
MAGDVHCAIERSVEGRWRFVNPLELGGNCNNLGSSRASTPTTSRSVATYGANAHIA